MKRTVFMLSLLCLVACGKSTDEVDANGNCKGSAIDSYNNIVYKSRTYLITKSIADAKEIDTACKSFQGVIGSQSCKAGSEGGGEMQISYETVKARCELVASALANYYGKPSSDEATIKDVDMKPKSKKTDRRSQSSKE